eukprot:128817-Pyramimonas_sp.AAC.1
MAMVSIPSSASKLPRMLSSFSLHADAGQSSAATWGGRMAGEIGPNCRKLFAPTPSTSRNVRKKI